MAKNFEQYDDTPVMAYISKAKEEAKQSSDSNEILKSASENIQENATKENIETTENFVQEEKTEPIPEPKKILMNISIRETTKKEWKMFFLEHDLSMTQGIETAVEYLKSEVQKGNIRLTKGGITK